MKSKPIGIHLGDFNSSVGTFEYTGVPEVIANDHGNLSTPSYVAFVGDQQDLIGEAAYDQANSNPENTVFAVNRFIGRRFEDKLVQKQISNVPFSVVNVGGWPMIEVENTCRKYSPKNICSMILGKLKQTAESYLATKVTEAVITVPDYFNDSQREAVKEAASTVGLTVLRFSSESETVAFAYELDKLDNPRKNVLILELNQEINLNVWIVDCVKGRKLLTSIVESFDIVDGDNLIEKIVDMFLEKYNEYKYLSTHKQIDEEKLRCLLKIEKRTILSNSSSLANLKSSFEYFFSKQYGFNFRFDYGHFEQNIDENFKESQQLISLIFEDAAWKITDIDAIVLIGNTTQVFKLKPFFYANFIDRNVKIYESIPHDKVFAYGATVQAAQMQEELCTIDRLFSSDCTPLNIGILLEGEIVCPIIERGTIIPTKKSKLFKILSNTSCDSWLEIYQGQCLFAQDNYYINKLYIPKLLSEIEVTVELDVKDTLIVSINHKTFNDSIEIANVKQRRTRAEIELMWEFAELHRVRDDYVRKRIGNSAELSITTFDYHTMFASKSDHKYFDCGNPEIEQPFIKSSIPQTLNTKIEKLFQKSSDDVEILNKSHLPLTRVINCLNKARGVLNRYSLTKKKFDSTFANEQHVILETFEQTILEIRELMLQNFWFEFEHKLSKFTLHRNDANKDSIISQLNIISNKALRKMRSIQNLMILLVNVLRGKETHFIGIWYCGVTNDNPETIKYDDQRNEIIDHSSITSIQETLETKVEQLFQAFNASNANSANSSQITNVIYNLKNVLFNTDSNSTFGDITFSNDESKQEIDVTKLEQTITVMQEIMLKFETQENTLSVTEIHRDNSASEEKNSNVLQQMSEIEQLLNTLVSAKQSNKKVKPKKTIQNKSSESKKLKRKRDLEKERSCQSVDLIEQNSNNAQIINENAGIIECFEINEKNEINNQLTDQQAITLEPIVQKSTNAQNSCENTKSYNEYNKESIIFTQIDQAEFSEVNTTQTIETAKIFEAIEHETETNSSEQSYTAPECITEQNSINAQIVNEKTNENVEIIEYFENNEKCENDSYSTDQQTITVESIEKNFSDAQNSNKSSKSYNKYNEESFAQSVLKQYDHTESSETNTTPTIERVQILEAIEQGIEINLSEQSDTTDECTNQEETISDTEQLLQQTSAFDLSNKKNCCCNLL